MSARPLPLRAVAIGFALAVAAVAVVVGAIGVDRIAAAIAAAEPSAVGALLAFTLVWFCAWSLSLFVALRSLGVSVSAPRTALVYASATFFNGLTPFAQLGGEALTAAVLARSTDVAYETGLSAVAASDAINLVPSVLLAGTGLGLLAASDSLPPGFRLAAVVLLGVVVAVGAVAAFAWSVRRSVARLFVRGSVAALRAADRARRRVTTVDPAAVGARVDRFVAGFEHLLADRRRLATCLALSVVGWAGLAFALRASLAAVGHPVPFRVVAFVLPVAMVAAVVPLPGGAGGVEAALVGLLVVVDGAPAATAAAAVILYRGATFWLPLLVGGGVTVVLATGGRPASLRGEG